MLDKEQKSIIFYLDFLQNEILRLHGVNSFIGAFLDSLKSDDKDMEYFNDSLQGAKMIFDEALNTSISEISAIKGNIQEILTNSLK